MPRAPVIAQEVSWGDRFYFDKPGAGPLLLVFPEPPAGPQQLIQLSEDPARTWGLTLGLSCQKIITAGNNCWADFFVTTGVGRAAATQIETLTLVGDGLNPKFVTRTLTLPFRSLLVAFRLNIPGAAGNPLGFEVSAFAAPQFPILTKLEGAPRERPQYFAPNYYRDEEEG